MQKLTGNALTEKGKTDNLSIELTLVVDENGYGDVTALRVGKRVYEGSDMPLQQIIGVLSNVLDQYKSYKLGSIIAGFLQEEEAGEGE